MSDDAQRIATVGSGELCSRLAYYFESTGFGRVVGVFDDFEAPGTTKQGRRVLGGLPDAPGLYREDAFDSVAIAIGYRHRRFRKQAFEYLRGEDVPMATFVHPSSHIERSAVVGEGSIVLLDCTVDQEARIGENVFLSARCFVSHNVDVHAHTYCGPAVALAGHTQVGECCFLGIRTTTVDSVKLGANVQTGAGSVIAGDVPSNVLVMGVPAVVKKKLEWT
jgi:sugar O-acyltransferase (sialic acid O-acetyltransferase NeuD family)